MIIFRIKISVLLKYTYKFIYICNIYINFII